MWYNESTTFGIITTIIFSVLIGVFSPIGSLGVNFLGSIDSPQAGQNLFSQISQIKNLSELNPTEALGNVTIPFDKILKVLGQKFNISSSEDIKNLLGVGSIDSLRDGTTVTEASKSALGGRLALGDTLSNISLGQALGMAKSAFILVANILVTVLEVVLWVLKGIIGLVT